MKKEVNKTKNEEKRKMVFTCAKDLHNVLWDHGWRGTDQRIICNGCCQIKERKTKKKEMKTNSEQERVVAFDIISHTPPPFPKSNGLSWVLGMG